MKHALALVGVVGFAFGAAAASAADEPIGVAIDGSAPAAITSGVVRQATTRRGAAVGKPFLCLSFRNHDARTATLVQFRFAYFGARGDILAAATFDRTGSFATGVDIVPAAGVLTGAFTADAGPNCRAFQPPEGTRRIDVDVTRIDFSDGSQWRGPFKNGMPSLPGPAPRDDATDSPVH